MTRTILRRATAAAVLVLALGALAACGGDNDPSADDSAPDSSSSAAPEPTEPTEPTASEPTEPVETEDATSSGEEIDPAEFIDVFKSAFEQASSSSIGMVVEGQFPLEATGVADFTVTPTEMSMSITSDALGQGAIDLVLVDKVFYVRFPGTGGKFTATDLNDPNNPLGKSFTDQLDPRAQFDLFEKGLTAATFVGNEDLRGESMDRFSISVDPKVFLQSLDPAARDQAKGLLPDELGYDLWFDDAGNFRQMVVDLGQIGGSVTATFDNWGDPVTIEAPPANQISRAPGG